MKLNLAIICRHESKRFHNFNIFIGSYTVQNVCMLQENATKLWRDGGCACALAEVYF